MVDYQRVKSEIKKNRISRKKLAELANVSMTTIGNYLNGLTPMPVSFLSVIKSLHPAFDANIIFDGVSNAYIVSDPSVDYESDEKELIDVSKLEKTLQRQEAEIRYLKKAVEKLNLEIQDIKNQKS